MKQPGASAFPNSETEESTPPISCEEGSTGGTLVLGSRSLCGGTGNYQCRIWPYKSHSIHRSVVPIGISQLALTPLVVAKLSLQSPIHVPHIRRLFFSTFSILLLSFVERCQEWLPPRWKLGPEKGHMSSEPDERNRTQWRGQCSSIVTDRLRIPKC
jgi:hypothetical protein